MKRKSYSMLIKIALIAVIIAALIAIARVNEGFQTTPTLVKVYFNTDGGNKPIFLSSDNPKVTFVSSAAGGGTAVLKVDPSLGELSGYSGCGYTNMENWVPLTASTLDRNLGGSLRLQAKVGTGTSAKYLRNLIHTATLLAAEAKLPKTLSSPTTTAPGNLTVLGLAKSTFGVGTKVDTSRNNATILVKLLFNAGTSTVAFPALTPC